MRFTIDQALLFALLGAAGCGRHPVAPAETSAPAPQEDVAPAPPSDVAPATSPEISPGDGVADADEEPAAAKESWELSPPARVPTVSPTTGACVPGLGDVDGDMYGFWYSAVNARALDLCADIDGAPRCWTLDLDTGVLAQAKVPKAAKMRHSGQEKPSFPKELKVAAGGRSVKSCVGKKCVPLALQGIVVAQAGVSAGRVFVASGPDMMAADASNAVRVYDGTTGVELSSHLFSALGSDCPIISWAGEVLYIEAGVCAGPGAVGLFFDPVGGKALGLLGGGSESAAAYGVTPIPLPSGNVAFREQYGRAIFFHDGKSGALVERINLVDALAKTPEGEPATSPEEGWMHAAPRADGRVELVLGTGGESRKRVTIVAPGEPSSVARVFELPSCPD